jgi:hypothetical protein
MVGGAAPGLRRLTVECGSAGDPFWAVFRCVADSISY